jgi:hypothetical protein
MIPPVFLLNAHFTRKQWATDIYFGPHPTLGGIEGAFREGTARLLGLGHKIAAVQGSLIIVAPFA